MKNEIGHKLIDGIKKMDMRKNTYTHEHVFVTVFVNKGKKSFGTKF